MKDLEGKEMKLPPGLRGAKSQQAMRTRTIEETGVEVGYKPLEKVELDLSENNNRRFTDEENYRAYKLFSVIDTNNAGTITLRELKRCLMGDTFRTFPKDFDHPDTGIIFGLDEDDCVVISGIEPSSPASLDPFLNLGLHLWSINGVLIPPHRKESLILTNKQLVSLFDDAVRFEFVEPILIVTKFSNMLDLQFDNQIYSVELPVGAVNNLEIFESKIKLAMRKKDKKLKQVHMNFDGKRRQAYFRSHHEEFNILFQTGPNRQRSCKFSLGFTNEDTGFGFTHRGQAMVFNLELGVKKEEAEIVFTELFEKFDEDKSGEFEFEEFRDFYIRFLDTEESIQHLRDYAQYKFRDQEKEAYYFELREKARIKKERLAATKEREDARRAEQRAMYMTQSSLDAFGIRRRVYGDQRPKDRIMIRKHRKPGRVPMKKFKDIEHPDDFAIDEDGGTAEKKSDEESFGDNTSQITKNSKKSINLKRMTPAERMLYRSEIRAKKKEQDLKRRMNLNDIYNSTAALKAANRKNVLRVKMASEAVHVQEVVQAIKRAAKSAVRISNTGVSGITQVNVSMTHVIASPAFVVTAAMFTGDVEPDSIELKKIGPKEMHPAVQRYFLIRRSKRVNADFDSELIHPVFFTADYEREPSRHSSFGFAAAKMMERGLVAGKKYRKENNIDEHWEHVPDWDKKYVPEKVKFVKPPPPLKANRLVGRATLVGIRALNLPRLNPLLQNSPFVTIICGPEGAEPIFKASTEVISAAGGVDGRWLMTSSSGGEEYAGSSNAGSVRGEDFDEQVDEEGDEMDEGGDEVNEYEYGPDYDGHLPTPQYADSTYNIRYPPPYPTVDSFLDTNNSGYYDEAQSFVGSSNATHIRNSLHIPPSIPQTKTTNSKAKRTTGKYKRPRGRPRKYKPKEKTEENNLHGGWSLARGGTSKREEYTPDDVEYYPEYYKPKPKIPKVSKITAALMGDLPPGDSGSYLLTGSLHH